MEQRLGSCVIDLCDASMFTRRLCGFLFARGLLGGGINSDEGQYRSDFYRSAFLKQDKEDRWDQSPAESAGKVLR